MVGKQQLLKRTGSVWRAVMLLFISVLPAINSHAQLSGTYTINPSASASSTNYLTFASAVSDLVSGTRADGGTANGAGVSGAVTFNVANGTYTEQISIDPITGASAANRITFQSASGDSSKVILTFASGSSTTNNFGLKLNGADYITFRKLTIQRTGTTAYARVIELAGGADNNIFANNRIRGVITTSTSNNLALIYSGNTKDTGNTYIQNSLKYGAIGIYNIGSSTNQETGNKVIGNLLDSIVDDQIYITYNSGLLIERNVITNKTGTGGYGIYLANLPAAPRVVKNKLLGITASYGIYLVNGDFTSTNPGIFANNFVSYAGAGTNAGIGVNNATYVNYYYNSVLVTSTSSSATAFYLASSSTRTRGYIRVMNNIFVNKGAGMAMEVTANAITAKQLDTSDYNDLYVTGSNFGIWAGTTYSSFSAWKTASKQDPNSVSVDPKFKSNTDLHVSAIALEGAALPVSGITDDIDGQTRSTTKPDIGADEFTPPADDAGLLRFISPGSASCAGSNNVRVRLRNAGLRKLDTVTITYLLNGTQQTSTQYYPGISTNDSIEITVGTVNVSSTPQLIKVFVSDPNNATDANPLNDTITMTVRSALAGGTYTIGTSGADYSTFAAAINDLKLRGICGAVTFNVANGTYNEKLVIPQIGGTSATNTITFKSASGDSSTVILADAASSSTTDNYLLLLDGADFITFRQMTFSRQGTGANGRVIELKGEANNNSFLNNRIFGANSTASSNVRANIFSDDNLDNNNTFRQNLIKYGAFGILLQGVSASVLETGLVIEDNIIDSVSNCGIQASYQEGAKVQRNKVTNVIGTSGTTYGIYIYYNNGSSTKRGLYANNMMSVAGSGTSYALSLYYSSFQDVVYNSVLSTASSTTAGRAFFATSSTTVGANNNRLFNNIFANTGGGVAFEIVNNALPSQMIDTSDYNNLYVTGTNIGKWGSTTVTDLATWKSVSSQDPNSVSVDPMFISVNDLHTKVRTLNNKGFAISQVNNDFDKEARSTTTPDIGADEFTPAADDAGVIAILNNATGVCAGTQAVTVTIKNYGMDTLRSADIMWTVDGTPRSTYKWTGKLATDSTEIVNIGNYSFTSGTVQIKAWTRNPNSATDPFAFNDTSVASVIVNPLPSATAGSNKAICNGQSTNIGSAPIPGNTYSWTSKPAGFTSTSSGPSVSPSVTTTYYLTETVNATGCAKSDSVTITVNPLPNAITGNDTAVCEGTGINLGATAVTGNTYSWTSIPAGFTSSVANPSVQHSVTTTFILTETVTATGCSKTDSVTVTINPLPQANVGNDGKICAGMITAVGSTGVTGNTYSWTSIPSGFTSTDANPNVSPLTTTSYILTETVTATGCSKTDTVTITVDSLPLTNAGADTTICNGQQTQIGMTAVAGNIYNWMSIPSGFTSSVSNPTVSPNVTTTYILTESSSNGCRGVDTVIVTVNPLPSAIAGQDRIICNGGNTQLGDSAVSGITYSWTSVPAGFTSSDANPIVNPVATTTYILNVSSATGCNATDSVTVTVAPNPSALVQGEPSVCAGSTVIYSTPAVSGISYTWSITGGTVVSGQNTDSVTITWDSTAGTASVKVIATSTFGGCTDSATIAVNIVSPPVIHWIVTQGSGKTFSFAPSDTTFVSYFWEFGDGNTSADVRPTHTYQNDSTYTVRLTIRTAEGCEVVKDSTVSVVTGITSIVNPLTSINIFPNPFKEVTTLKYTLNEKARVQVSIYDITGREIANLENATQTPGNYQYQFDANKYNANAGVYFVKVVVGDKLVTRQIVNVK